MAKLLKVYSKLKYAKVLYVINKINAKSKISF